MSSGRIGSVYGELTVIDEYKTEKGYWKCTCQCTCGVIKDISYPNLKSGRTRSCGHLEKANREKFKDLTGKTFGDLTVMVKAPQRLKGEILWRCRCTCGRMLEVTRTQLVRGYAKSCGFHQNDQLIGKHFNQLQIIRISEDNRHVYCQCSCGATLWTYKYNVLSGHTKSCGHLLKADHFQRIDGVVVSALARKISSRNTSGYTGVSKTANGKWTAYITLKYKRHTLGVFDQLEEAVRARKNAEEHYFNPILEKAHPSKS